ncbi:MAG: class I SAM-dependent DNA methyltransferase, partial [Myxococcales bacterium]|nr:class I SAM-dependent DNA methyltransferase [Myxococcales bacterium]
FHDPIKLPAFDGAMRATLVECAAFDWSKISPAIFGSIFQGVMDPPKRRQIGAHYTSERDILRVLRSTFIDEFEAELARARALRVGRSQRLNQLHDKLARLKIFDPACGCGNFLILAFREARRLEQEILVALHTDRHGHVAQTIDIRLLNRVSVDQFYGIELLSFPCEIARTGMWLMDHLMNLSLSAALGQYFVRLPLSGTTHITCGNALRSDWREVLPPGEDVIIVGNPPFVGKKEQNKQQKQDMAHVWPDIKGTGVLDYVTCWYRRAVEFMAGTRTRCALVSTNSITQGEQVAILWPWLHRHGVIVHFAHRTFAWISEARGKAHVHVVIIGFALFEPPSRQIFEHTGETEISTDAANINPYLVDAQDVYVTKRRSPLFPAPPLAFGNMPNDGGHLLLTDEERTTLLAREPALAKFIRLFVGPDELMHGVIRWCFWLTEAKPAELRRGELKRRLAMVREHREGSSREATQKLAVTPALFGEIRQPDRDYLAIPKTGSERRRYVPMAFLSCEHIASTDIFTCPDAGLFHFGVLSSHMHMLWVLAVGGRFKSDPRYSATLIYNNFPWPAVDEQKQAAIEQGAAAVLAAREQYPESTLGALYDLDAMPAELAKAHAKLDAAVERAYQRGKFKSDRQRLELLFALLEQQLSA